MKLAWAQSFAVAIVVLSGWISSVFGQLPMTGKYVPEFQAVDTLLENFMVGKPIPGGTITITRDDKVIYERGFGHRNQAKTLPMQETALMRLASVSKPITASAIQQLAKDGQLDLNDKVFNIDGNGGILNITPYNGTLGDSRLRDITLQHLLEHAGGWNRDTAGDLAFRDIQIANAMGVPSPPGIANTAQYILSQPLQFTPGTNYNYSNVGYMFLGMVVEEVSAQRYESYVDSNVLAPAGIPAWEVDAGRTFAADQNPREPVYSDPLLTQNVYNPTGPSVPWPYGGWDNERFIALGGLIASSKAIAMLAQDRIVAGPEIGKLRSDYTTSPEYWWYHGGSLPGTDTLLMGGQGVWGADWKDATYSILFDRRPTTATSYSNDLALLLEPVLEGIATWPAPLVYAGDFTYDQWLTLDDITLFTHALALGSEAAFAQDYPTARYAAGDFDGNGHVNTSDAAGLIAALEHAGVPAEYISFVPELPGDYNDDGVVDAADYTVWRDNVGVAISLPNEVFSLGVVDESDYEAWRSNFGTSLGAGSGASLLAEVPEPSALFLVTISLIGIACCNSVRRRSILASHFIPAVFPFVAFAAVAHADIYQWEYINPADPGEGKRQSTTLAPDGAGVDAVPGVDLSLRNLQMAYLHGVDLSNAHGHSIVFADADLTNANLRNVSFENANFVRADFTDADVRGAFLGLTNYSDIRGISLPQLYSTASYKFRDLSGIVLNYKFLNGGSFAEQKLNNAGFNFSELDSADFREADLTGAWFYRASLTDADFSGAEIRGATFEKLVELSCGWPGEPCVPVEYGTGITLEQLYSTASYQTHDLSGINVVRNNLAGGNFANVNLGGTNLTGANLRRANLANAVFTNYECGLPGCSPIPAPLTDADLTATDARGSDLFTLVPGPYSRWGDFQLVGEGAIAVNMIRPDGQVDGLNLGASDLLVVRDYDGNPAASLAPIPITIDQHLSMAPGGTLRMVFEADAWDSTISFAPGIPVALGGTLELTFAEDVNPVTQLGRTFDLFDWTGVDPTGAFAIASPYRWDTSNLDTTGEVTMTAVPEPLSLTLLAIVLPWGIARRRPVRGPLCLPAWLICAVFMALTSTSSYRATAAPITVMTQNLYQGFDGEQFLADVSANPANVVALTTAAYAQVLANDFASRSAAIALAVEQHRPALIGLQEASLYRSAPFDGPGLPHATNVELDYVDMLLGALSARGLSYAQVATVENTDAEFPRLAGFDANNNPILQDIRLTDRDVILARADLAPAQFQVSNPQSGNYAASSSALGVTLLNGWTAVNVEAGGSAFRFVSTHLARSPAAVQELQPAELLAGPASSSLPTILVGDFNSRADGTGTASYANLTAAGFSDAWNSVHPGDPGYTCCQAANLLNDPSQLSERIDLVLFRNGPIAIDAQILGASPADRTSAGLWPSDHAGLVATLTIVPEPGTIVFLIFVLPALINTRRFILRRSSLLQLAAISCFLGIATAAQADIYQWEYINPADPGEGKRQSTTLAPDGEGVDAVPAVYLAQRNLTMAYLIGADLTNAWGAQANLTNADLSQANLTNAYFERAIMTGANLRQANLTNTGLSSADLTGADLTDAEIRGATLSNYGGPGINLAQLYSTASYKNHDLSGVQLTGNNLAGADFSDQNLAGANLGLANLTGVNLSRANLYGASLSGATVIGADFTDADVNGALLSREISLAQLYSTASYRAHDLSGVVFDYGNLAGGNFVGQNLSNAYFYYTTLTGADFSQAIFNTTSFYGSNLTGANFREADLRGADLAVTQLTGADFTGAEIRGARFGFSLFQGGTGISLTQLYTTASYLAKDLTGINFSFNSLAGGDFSSQNLTGAVFGSATLIDADFREANAAGVDFSSANLSGADFSRADLTSAVLASTTLTGAQFHEANLTGANLGLANLTGADLRTSTLTGANFREADVTGASFAGQNLRGTNFYAAELSGADFTGAEVRDANFGKDIYYGYGGTGIALAQLYSTASYEAHDLTGIRLDFNDLSGGNFANQKLARANLESATLTGADLRNANLAYTNLSLASLEDADFREADLTGARLVQANVAGANFAGQNLSTTDLTYATVTDADFTDAVIRGAKLGSTGITLAQLYSTASYQARDLGAVTLYYNNLAGGNFAGQNLANADFYRATLTDADFSGANVSAAKFSYATLTSASFREATLKNTNFDGATLDGVNFSEANLTQASFVGATLDGAEFTGADIRSAKFGKRLDLSGSLAGTGISLAQLYSTASYGMRDLSVIDFSYGDFSGGDFAGQNLARANLGNTTLSGADFHQANLTEAWLMSAALSDADFSQANLAKANFTLAALTGANFRQANLSNAELGSATLVNADFTDAEIRGASLIATGITLAQLYSTASYRAGDLSGTALNNNNLSGGTFAHLNLSNASFANATLTGADFREANLSHSYFYTANLAGADFTDAEIRGANFGATTDRGFTLAQLYSTASYRAKDLSGTVLYENNLDGANFADLNLAGANFAGASLTGADFRDANLTNSFFPSATLTGADFTGAEIRGASFDYTTARGFTLAQLYSTASYHAKNLSGISLASNDLSGGNFSGQNLAGANFSGATLTDVNFHEADLADANFALATLNSADLSRAGLTNADFYSAMLTGADFRKASAGGTSFSYALLMGADFRQANVDGASFNSANLTDAQLADGNLSNADFSYAILTGADLTGADVRGASFRRDMYGDDQYSGTGITLAQLYSTASYDARDLSGINLTSNNKLSGGNFGSQNLSNAIFDSAALDDATFFKADLTNASLYGAYLSRADFRQANLTNASLYGTLLSDADFTDAEIRGADFAGNGLTLAQLYSTASYRALDLSGAKFDGSNFANGNFIGQNLTNASFLGSTLTDADFTDAEIRGTSLIATGITLAQLYSTASYRAKDLTGVKLDSNNLAGADFAGYNLTNATFSGATLTDTYFTDAQVRGADFSYTTTVGFTTGQLYSTASYQAHDLTGINFRGNNLTGWNFAGQNLSNANFALATLTGADFTGARVRGAIFAADGFFAPPEATITLTQLYTTASYQAHDLVGIDLGDNNLSGADFTGQNLTNSRFGRFRIRIFGQSSISYAVLTGADLSGADTRGTQYLNPSGATTSNMILPDGHISGVDLGENGVLVVRDYDGNPTPRANAFPFNPIPSPLPPIPITIDQHLAMAPGGTLRMVFEADAWNSTISFAPGIPVALGGTLELTFADDVNPTAQLGRTFDLFDWTGVTPTGAFAISSPYRWDLSNLYTTGQVTLTAVPEPSTMTLLTVVLALAGRLRRLGTGWLTSLRFGRVFEERSQ